MHICDWCQREFTPARTHAKTCSTECRTERRKARAREYARAKYAPSEPRQPIACASCGEPFVPYRESTKYCSRRCAWREGGRQQRPATRPCSKCWTPTPTRPGIPVCDECKVDRRDPVRAKAKEQRRRLRTYGITQEQYDAMFAAQGEACAICKANTPGGKGWCIDHCHTTDVVRGILCGQCNLGLGQFRDNPDLLTAARLYLLRIARDGLPLAG